MIGKPYSRLPVPARKTTGPVKYDIRSVRKRTYEELLTLRLTEEEANSVDRFPVSMILEDIRSLYNVGSIFRSADSFRVQELILTGFTPAPPRKEISKTALGADATVPHQQFTGREERWMDSVAAVKHMKERGWTVLALEITTDSRPLSELQPADYPLCIVAGNELNGISEQALAECDGALEIPMHGVKHSLNVAVASGIAMYEAVRQLP